MNQASADTAIADSVQIVSKTRAELTGLLELVRADFDGIPRSGFDAPTALEFQALVTRWDELAERLIGTLTALENALCDASRQRDCCTRRDAPRDPGTPDAGQVLHRLEAALQRQLPLWPPSLVPEYTHAQAEWTTARTGLDFVREQVEYLVLGVGSDA